MEFSRPQKFFEKKPHSQQEAGGKPEDVFSAYREEMKVILARLDEVNEILFRLREHEWELDDKLEKVNLALEKRVEPENRVAYENFAAAVVKRLGEIRESIVCLKSMAEKWENDLKILAANEEKSTHVLGRYDSKTEN